MKILRLQTNYTFAHKCNIIRAIDLSIKTKRPFEWSVTIGVSRIDLNSDTEQRIFKRPSRYPEDDPRPRDWQPRRSQYKVPLRLLRLCLLGIFLPAVLVAGPMYLRYRVYSEQLYPLTASDQRLIDAKVSTTWCQVSSFPRYRDDFVSSLLVNGLGNTFERIRSIQRETFLRRVSW